MLLSLQFAQPPWLWVLAGLLPVLLAALWLSARRARRRRERFAASALGAGLAASYSPVRWWLQQSMLLAAVALVLMALARPQWGFRWEEQSGRGIDVLIALDVSRSMLAEDLSPNRLERSKLAIRDLLGELQGHRAGLIPFSGSAFLQVPLTLDHAAFLQALDTLEPGQMPRGGTDFAAAIREALEAQGGEDNFTFLILITDGEDLEARGQAAAREAAEAGLRLFTVGVGTESGALIPITGEAGERAYLRDLSGNYVNSRLEERTLLALAEATQGAYAPLGPAGEGLREVYRLGVAGLPQEALDAVLQPVPLERYGWPLSAALVLLLVRLFLSNRRRVAQRLAPHTLAKAAALWLWIGLCAAVLTPEARAGLGEAERLFARGDYAAAAERYAALIDAAGEEADVDPRLHYNHGNALFRAGEHRAAAEAFERALNTSDTALQQDAFYNLGLAWAFLGQAQLDAENPAEARASWDRSSEQFHAALGLEPEDADAQANLGVVRAHIEAITHPLEVLADPETAGSVSGGGRYLPGSTATVTARPAPDWAFVRWDGAAVEQPDSAETALLIEKPERIRALFARLHDLTVTVDAPERGEAGTSGRYAEGSAVAIEATPNDYWAFTGWTTADTTAVIEDDTQAQTTVTLGGPATLTATFTEAYKLDVSWQPRLGGTAGPSGFYPVDQTLPIQAQPREGFAFLGWLGEGIQAPLEAQTEVLLDQDRSVVAEMERLWRLIVYTDNPQAGTVSGSADADPGTIVPIEAVPAEGFRFAGWEGPGVTDPTLAQTFVTVEDTPEHDVRAIFAEDESQQNPDEQEQDQQEQQEEQQGEQDQEQEQQGEQDSDAEDSEGDGQEAEQEQEQEPSEPQGEDGSPEEDTPEGADRAPPVVLPMSEEEARQLLEQLRSQERQLPAADQEGEADEATESRGRDW